MANHTDHPKFVCDVDGASIADKVLIAAAPEMLAVCEWLVRVHSAFMADDHPLMVAARAAFAKAEGRQS
ncbi:MULTISPECIES: hypothetical protein [unclassified Mesorhizobium]|uniref:hypothetical protein n=1 Tax=unclassified Mesorhizobium TaxID=325217 RepID=UPI001128344C|nr:MULTISPECIES: hypothetical protein [unclassified Mesorhizobium]TPJ70495.1 hypothetical protein FJ462_07320 [Mesorhizobium sp. B2-6-7]TPJ76848.1 hypothetical protein FJ422_29500 [Mesorhizobium sp. B2-6-3]